MAGPQAVGFTTENLLNGPALRGTEPVTTKTPLPVQTSGLSYKNCPAGATTALGAAGKLGDYLGGLLVIPATTGAGNVSIVDGTSGAVTTLVFTGGGTLGDLKPFFIPLGLKSRVGGWSITCGTNVAALAVGSWS